MTDEPSTIDDSSIPIMELEESLEIFNSIGPDFRAALDEIHISVDEDTTVETSIIDSQNAEESLIRSRLQEIQNLAYIAHRDAEKAKSDFLKSEDKTRVFQEKMHSTMKYAERLKVLAYGQELQSGYTATLSDKFLLQFEQLNLIDVAPVGLRNYIDTCIEIEGKNFIKNAGDNLRDATINIKTHPFYYVIFLRRLLSPIRLNKTMAEEVRSDIKKYCSF